MFSPLGKGTLGTPFLFGMDDAKEPNFDYTDSWPLNNKRLLFKMKIEYPMKFRYTFILSRGNGSHLLFW